MKLIVGLIGGALSAMPQPATKPSSFPATTRNNVCPTLDARNHIFPVSRPVGAPSLPTGVAIDISAVSAAYAIVRNFEGSSATYATVSPRDIISIGRSQWNAHVGTLSSVLLRATSAADIGDASPPLAADLTALKASKRDRDPTAVAILRRWTSASPGAPLVGGINAGVRRNLEAWLNTPAMRSVQDRLAAADLQTAASYAAAWQRDMYGAPPSTPVSPRLLTYFNDFVVFSGGTGGVWVDHVRAYRAAFPKTEDALSDMTAWLDSCTAAEARGRKIYAVRDARRNLAYWRTLAVSDPSRFDDATMDLLVYGFLRARQHAGDDYPHSQPGTYQPSVFYRRGIEAIGMGWFNGASGKPIDIYRWAQTR